MRIEAYNEEDNSNDNDDSTYELNIPFQTGCKAGNLLEPEYDPIEYVIGNQEEEDDEEYGIYLLENFSYDNELSC